jgi:hypothetical protein
MAFNDKSTFREVVIKYGACRKEGD